MKFEIEKVDCREKDSEIRDLKEKVVKLEMEKADCIYKFCFFHLQLHNLFLQISYFWVLFSTVYRFHLQFHNFFLQISYFWVIFSTVYFFYLELHNIFLQISYFLVIFSTVNATFCRHRSFFYFSLQNLACNNNKKKK